MSFWGAFRNPNKIKNLSSLETSSTFCMMPWVHFHITQYGTVTPCCQAPWQEEQAFGNINKQSISEIWNGDSIRNFRKNMYAGKADTRCESCFKKEKEGFVSLRKITNSKYKHKFPDVLRTSGSGDNISNLPIYFDIRFSNICNLRCRICGPWSSSSWHNDAVLLGMTNENSKAITYSFENPEEFMEQFKEAIPYLEELYFAGGEPLVIDEHYQVLNLLIQHQKTEVQLTYNTNFSSFTYKNHNIVELWKQFPRISLAASLDASELKGEFLRKNLQWETVVENRKFLLEHLPHIEFVVSPTLNIYNLLHLPDFHKDWVEKKLIHVEDFIPTLLVSPKDLSVAILPRSFKNKAIQRYQEHLHWIQSAISINHEKRDYMIQQFKNIIVSLSLDNEPEAVASFIKKTETIDKVRKENTRTIFPELEELFTNY